MKFEKIKRMFVRDNDVELRETIEKAIREDAKETNTYTSPFKVYLGSCSRKDCLSPFKQAAMYSPV